MFLRFLTKVLYLHHFYSSLASLTSSIPLFTLLQIHLFKLLLLRIYVYINYTPPHTHTKGTLLVPFSVTAMQMCLG